MVLTCTFPGQDIVNGESQHLLLIDLESWTKRNLRREVPQACFRI